MLREGSFSAGDMVVYPGHGVGTLTSEEKQVIAGNEFVVYVISFDDGNVVIRVPKSSAIRSGLRHISTKDEMEIAINILEERSQINRGMWSKRSKEYDKKVNSGSITKIAEVLRDLHKNDDEGDRKSYSEKQIYDSAVSRFVQEYSAVSQIEYDKALNRVMSILNYR